MVGEIFQRKEGPNTRWLKDQDYIVFMDFRYRAPHCIAYFDRTDVAGKIIRRRRLSNTRGDATSLVGQNPDADYSTNGESIGK